MYYTIDTQHTAKLKYLGMRMIRVKMYLIARFYRLENSDMKKKKKKEKKMISN